MTDEEKAQLPIPTREAPPYEVGYKRPPTHTRFKPGQSGNPRGRPRGSKNKPRPITEERLQDIVLEEAYRTIPVRDGDQMVDVPMAQAVMRSIAVNAAKGQARAQTLFTQILTMTEQKKRAEGEALLKAAMDYKEYWAHELAYRARTGATGPEPLPHPDHVHIDRHTGEVTIKGPVTKEEKAEHEGRIQRLKDEEDELVMWKRELANPPDDARANYCTFVEDQIAMSEHIIAMLSKAVAYDFQGAAEVAKRGRRKRRLQQSCDKGVAAS